MNVHTWDGLCRKDFDNGAILDDVRKDLKDLARLRLANEVLVMALRLRSAEGDALAACAVALSYIDDPEGSEVRAREASGGNWTAREVARAALVAAINTAALAEAEPAAARRLAAEELGAGEGVSP